jgi:hypothetical protein
VRWILIALVVLVVLVAILDVLIDEPLRASIERRMNERLAGYSVRLAEADGRPWNFSVEFEDLVVRQEANPKPAVLDFPAFGCSVQWKALLRLRLVGDCELERPRLHIDLEKLRHERDDDVDIQDRGWQEALQEMYPLKINEFRIHDAAITYIGDDPEHPLELTRLQALIENIRNVRSPEAEFPSTVEATAMVFDTGPARLEGRADFLREPYAATRAAVRVEGVPLDRLQPIIDSYQVSVESGTLSARGEIEYTPEVQRANLEEVVIDGVRIDYVSDPELTRRAVEALSDAKRDPSLEVDVGLLRLVDSELGFINRARDPDYRVFVTDTDLTVKGWTNRAGADPSELEARGLFMGSGETVVRGLFRPDLDGPDLDLAVAIRGTRLESMNDMLRAHAKLDVVDGTFSFFSELRIADGRIDGYVKPLFREVDVFDPEQDKPGGFFHNLWERIADGIANLLENRPREEVVTIADLAGNVDDPRASNLQVVLNLIENAFIKAILPGFLDRAGKGDGKDRDDRDDRDRDG